MNNDVKDPAGASAPAANLMAEELALLEELRGCLEVAGRVEAEPDFDAAIRRSLKACNLLSKHLDTMLADLEAERLTRSRRERAAEDGEAWDPSVDETFLQSSSPVPSGVTEEYNDPGAT